MIRNSLANAATAVLAICGSKRDLQKISLRISTLFYLIGTIPVVWLALLLAQSLGGGLPELLRNLTSALEQPTNIIWTDKSLPTILICLAAYGMAVLLYRTNQGRTRDGEKHGSAVWATPASVNAQFAQKDSIPLTQHVRLGLDTHKHRRPLNVLVIGGSGAAKTRSFVLPNILTANTNYVITDPKSEVLLATGGYLKEQGYDVRVLNLVNLEQSDGYNPFRYSIASVICFRAPWMIVTVPPMGASCTMVISAKMIFREPPNFCDTAEISGSETFFCR